MRHRFRLIGFSAIATILFGAASSNAALLISFDGPGYSTSGSTPTVVGTNGSSIKGQGDTAVKWDDPGTNFAVVANAGNGGNNNALVTATSQTSTQSITYTPSLSSLGAASFSTASRQDFSLDVRLVSNGGLSGGTELYRLQIGLQSSSIYPVYLRFTANGNVVAVNGANQTQLTMSGALADNQYHTLSGSIDYSTSTYTLALDGEAKGSAISFATAGVTSYGQFKLNVRQTSATAGIAIDNVSAAVVVPEPGMLGLAGFGTGLVLLRRRRSAGVRSR